MGIDSHSVLAVAIITGGSARTGREVARMLASWAWPIVIVYLDHQSRAEAAVMDLIATGGRVVAVRADLADDLDVQRLFTESITAFGAVDVVVHTTADDAELLYTHAVRHLRRRGAIVVTSEAELPGRRLASRLSERGIMTDRAAPEALPAFFSRWQQTPG